MIRRCIVARVAIAASGECRKKIIDQDRFEIAQVLNGQTEVQQWYRVKD
jgi:hypothetical protein